MGQLTEDPEQTWGAQEGLPANPADKELGQAADEPLQLTVLSHAPAELWQTVPAERKLWAGQVPEVPVQ